MANGANYQESGTTPLRCNPTSFTASIPAAGTSGVHVTPSTVPQTDGTANLRADPRDLHAPIISGTGTSSSRQPGTVDTFKDATV